MDSNIFMCLFYKINNLNFLNFMPTSGWLVKLNWREFLICFFSSLFLVDLRSAIRNVKKKIWIRDPV